MSISPELISKYSVSGPRYTSYPTAAEFRDDFPADEWPKMLHSDACNRTGAFYVHLPFCRSLCYFCACHKVITSSHAPVRRYLHALKAEMRIASDYLGVGFAVDHLHLGGGTPNFLEPRELEELIRGFDEAFPCRTDNAELSIELDPRTTSREHVRMLAHLGFTRISCGVQDFDSAVQEAINRHQTFEQTRELFDSARNLGLESINIDLIYGLPRQTLSGFEQTLDRVLCLRPDRVALYGYAHLPSREKVQTSFRRFPLPAPAERIALLLLAVTRLESAGYVFIGIDHFALPTDPLVRAQKEGTLRRNFMGYTDRVSEPLIGFGVSAISSLPGAFAQNEKRIDEYERSLLDEAKLPVKYGVIRTPDDRVRGEIIERLLCDRRVSYENFRARLGVEFEGYFAESLRDLQELEGDGLIRRTSTAIEITSPGEFFLRNVAMAFDRYLPARRSDVRPVFSQAV